jgi:opacity protein-like surface antigen
MGVLLYMALNRSDSVFVNQTEMMIMKRKVLASLLVTGICAVPSLTQAATPYVSANVGLGYANNSEVTSGATSVNDGITFKVGVPFGGAVGLREGDYRVEAALGYQLNGADQLKANLRTLSPAASNDKASVFSYMANAYYDHKMQGSDVTPYIMAGLGGATINPQGANLEGASQSVFAWQVGAGVGVKASDNVVVDVGYRYFKPSAYTVTDPAFGNAKFTVASSNVMLGLRYNF